MGGLQGSQDCMAQGVPGQVMRHGRAIGCMVQVLQGTAIVRPVFHDALVQGVCVCVFAMLARAFPIR